MVAAFRGETLEQFLKTRRVPGARRHERHRGTQHPPRGRGHDRDHRRSAGLKALLGDYPVTRQFKQRSSLEFADVKVPNTAFKRVVRDLEFDVAELALMTFLLAKAHGKPYRLLPAVVTARFQHATLAYNPERGTLSPDQLAGKRVGMRSYSVTTATWVRGILARDYGVDLDSVKWVTFEDPHVAEYKDPPTATRASAGKEIAKMLLDGELDAAVVGDKLPDPRLKTLIPDAEGVARAWATRNGGVPINHMAVVRDTIVKSRPDVVKEIYRLLQESKRAARLPTDGTPEDPLRFGIEPNRKALELIIDICAEQKLIARRFTVDELFQDTRQILGL
jgi:4,5-dihydroxyphthalate decarboxylase